MSGPQSDREGVPGVLTLGTGNRAPRAAGDSGKPYACGGCEARWSGIAKAHCSGCHRTFAGAGLFDRHRRLRGEVGTCVDPATIESKGLPLRLIDGVWCGPELPADALAKMRGAR